MEYRTYGQTGMKLSVLGFGAMRFEEPINVERSVRAVLKAFEHGVNYFDTAPGYCQDMSEIIIGQAVGEMKKTAKPFYLSVKSMQLNGSLVRRDLERSLKRLNVEAIDVYHCWYLLNLPDWERRKAGGAVKEMLKAKEEGLIRHLAFSAHMSGREIRTVIQEGVFEGVTLGYSVINFPFREDGINAAIDQGMGITVMNPLGGGIIVPNEDAFGFIKVRPEQTMLEAALHFLLANEKLTVLLVGFRNEADVHSAVHAINNYTPYQPEQIQTIRTKVEQDFNQLCTTCMYCDVCPEQIPVWKFMDAYNHVLLRGGMPAFARLQFYWGVPIQALDKCTQCGACEQACTQHLPILERFEKLKNVVAKQMAR
jgi:predicted aldo/keto reductase-like oxidoreductase